MSPVPKKQMRHLLDLQYEKLKRVPERYRKFVKSKEKLKATAEFNCQNAPQRNQIILDSAGNGLELDSDEKEEISLTRWKINGLANEEAD